MAVTGWKEHAAAAQQSVLDSIPPKWKLASTDSTQTDVRHVPSTCGLLTSEELDITSLTVTELLAAMKARRYSAVQVAKAFCARAAIAHQLVSCRKP